MKCGCSASGASHALSPSGIGSAGSSLARLMANARLRSRSRRCFFARYAADASGSRARSAQTMRSRALGARACALHWRSRWEPVWLVQNRARLVFLQAAIQRSHGGPPHAIGAAIRSILAREGHVAHIWQRPDVRCQNNGGSCTADDASGEWTNTFRRASESSAHSACRNDAR